MATVIDYSTQKGFDGIGSKKDSQVVVLPAWIKCTLCFLTVMMVIVLVMASVALGMGAGNVALALGSGNVITNSPNPPSGYKYGGPLITKQEQWVSKKDLLYARSDMAAVACGKKIYIIGGLQNNPVVGTVLDTVTEYDPIFDKIKVLAPMPSTRYRFAAGCIADTDIIVAGGFDSVANSDAASPLTTNSVISYNIKSDKWTVLPALPTPRADVTGSVIDGKFYVVGGYEKDYAVSTKNEVYADGKWSAKKDLPSPRGDVTSAVISGKMFVTGGVDDAFNFASSVYAYSPSTDTWTAKANLPTPHGDSVAVAVDGVLHVVGGESWSGETAPCSYDVTKICNINEVPSHDHFVYDEKNDFWTEDLKIGISRFRVAGAAGPQGGLWIFGGTTDNLVQLTSVETYYTTKGSNLYFHIKK
jgi:N-acetylneuraminic acid mutarotase